MSAPRPIHSVLLLVVTILLLAPQRTAAQSLLITPARSIGPIRLGMTGSQVQRILGRPASRVGDLLWNYEQPFKLRIEFGNAKVKSVTTWDPRARTADGLGVGAPEAAVVRALGGAPESIPTFPGAWLYNRALGFAVYVQGGLAAAFVVVPVPTAPTPGVPPTPGPHRPSP